MRNVWRILTACFVWQCATLFAQRAPANLVDGGAGLRVLPGFRAELVYKVPKELGSWITMTADARGRLVVSAQNGSLYRVKPPPIRDAGRPPGRSETATRVERIDLRFGRAHGLAFVRNDLYAVVSEDSEGDWPKTGLYRLRDTNGDDRFDEVTRLSKLDHGLGEHGPHGIAVGPDGQSLYVVAGNHTGLPDGVDRCLVPDREVKEIAHSEAQPGQTKSTAAHGWICRTDLEGEIWDVVCVGLRNAYDLAFHPSGELFTYDSDAESDLGRPWYRPTRLLHVRSGLDFGWRGGATNSPSYYPDTAPPVLDMGQGSPAGMCFGTGTRFPREYQRALFVCDWSYGRLYAVHFFPTGGTYQARAELFAAGTPFPAADITVGTDGGLYIVAGGRHAESAIYRLTHIEGRPAEKPPIDITAGAKLRRHLESFHTQTRAKHLDEIWPQLDNPDPSVRTAARIALGLQPATRWHERAFKEPSPQKKLQALVALAHVAARRPATTRGPGILRPRIVAALNKLPWDQMSHADRLACVCAYRMVWNKLGRFSESNRGEVLARLDLHYPSGDARMDRELAHLLLDLGSTGLVGRFLLGLNTAVTEDEQLEQVAFLSRTFQHPWSAADHQAFLRWLKRGLSSPAMTTNYYSVLHTTYGKALKRLTPQERATLPEDLRSLPPVPKGPPPNHRKVVREWTVEELQKAAAKVDLAKLDVSRGTRLFAAASCYACHRLGKRGSTIGPDLTRVASRYSVSGVIEAIVLPERHVPDEYVQTAVVLKNGKTIVGKLINMDEEFLSLRVNFLDPWRIERVEKRRVARLARSPVSPMPAGLLNTLKQEEILELLAFLVRRG